MSQHFVKSNGFDAQNMLTIVIMMPPGGRFTPQTMTSKKYFILKIEMFPVNKMHSLFTGLTLLISQVTMMSCK